MEVINPREDYEGHQECLQGELFKSNPELNKNISEIGTTSPCNRQSFLQL
jgi:hypothetical protein